MLELAYLAEILALGVVAALALREGGTKGWETIGAVSAIAAPTCWLVALVAWHTIGSGKSLVVIGVLSLPLAAPFIYGASRRLLSQRWRQGGIALAVCWALGALGIFTAFPVLAMLLIPAFVALPFWVIKIAVEIGREPPQPETPLVVQNWAAPKKEPS
jgi:hypothetical protein